MQEEVRQLKEKHIVDKKKIASLENMIAQQQNLIETVGAQNLQSDTYSIAPEEEDKKSIQQLAIIEADEEKFPKEAKKNK